MPLETAMGGLRYLAMLLAAAESNGIMGATMLADMRGEVQLA